MKQFQAQARLVKDVGLLEADTDVLVTQGPTGSWGTGGVHRCVLDDGSVRWLFSDEIAFAQTEKVLRRAEGFEGPLSIA